MRETELFDNIPAEFTENDQWVCWSLEHKEGGVKPTKIPKMALSTENASTTDNDTWCSFEDAVGRYETDSSIEGIAYVLSGDDGLAFIDIDAYKGTDSKEREENAVMQQAMLDQFHSYSERSQSGDGYHILIHVAQPGKGMRSGPLEVYSQQRLVVMTGDYVNDAALMYFNDMDEVCDVIREMPEVRPTLTNDLPPTSLNPDEDGNVFRSEGIHDDEELRRTCELMKNGPLFMALYNDAHDQEIANLRTGDKRGVKFDGESEKDFALMNIIGYKATSPDQILRIFDESDRGDLAIARNKNRAALITTALKAMIPKNAAPKGFGDNFTAPVPTSSNVYHEISQSADDERIEYEKGQRELTKMRSNGGEYRICNDEIELMDLSFEENESYDQEVEVFSKLELETARRNVEQLMKAEYSQIFAPPKGLLGEVIKHCYNGARSPSKVMATNAGLWAMSTIAGREYTVSGLALCMYPVVLAESGAGKSSGISAINSLASAVDKSIEDSGRHMMTAAGRTMTNMFASPTMASKQAIMAYQALDEANLSVGLIIDECGLKLQMMLTDKSNGPQSQMKVFYTESFNAADEGATAKAYLRANQKDCIDAPERPLLNILHMGTPDAFIESLSGDVVSDGYLSRLTVFNSKEPLGKGNHSAGYKIPTPLIKGVSKLMEKTNLTAVKQETINVPLDDDAETIREMLVAFQQVAGLPGMITEDVKALYNRVTEKTLKMAATYAIGEDLNNPVIKRHHMLWGARLALYSANTVADMFIKGDAGGNNEANKNVIELGKKLAKLYQYGPSDSLVVKGGGAFKASWEDKVIQIGIATRLSSTCKSFKYLKQRSVGEATKAAMKSLEAMEMVNIIDEIAGQAKYGGRGANEMYRLSPHLLSLLDD